MPLKAAQAPLPMARTSQAFNGLAVVLVAILVVVLAVTMVLREIRGTGTEVHEGARKHESDRRRQGFPSLPHTHGICDHDTFIISPFDLEEFFIIRMLLSPAQ